MSVIDKKPLIRKVLQTLSKDDLVFLDSLVNGEVNNPVFRSLVPNSAHILSVADKGVKEVQLEVGLSVVQQLYNGYLIYNNNYCALIAYSAKKNADLNLLIMTQDNLGRWNYKITSCGLTILELRSELNDLLVEAGVNVKDSRIPDVTASDDGKVLVARGDSFALEDFKSSNIISIDGVDLSNNGVTTSKTLTPANWILATDQETDCELILYVTNSTQAIYPIEEMIEISRISVSDEKVIFGGTFAHLDNTNVSYTISAVFTENSGLISILEAEVDDSFSTTSTNPVQNKVVATAINSITANELQVVLSDTAVSGANQLANIKITRPDGTIENWSIPTLEGVEDLIDQAITGAINTGY